MAALCLTLRHLSEENDLRRPGLAERYAPLIEEPGFNTHRQRAPRQQGYDQCVVRFEHRDSLSAYFRKRGIRTAIHSRALPHRDPHSPEYET